MAMLRREVQFVRRRGGIWMARVHIPTPLRPLIGRREVWRSLRTANRREARLRAAIFQGNMGAPFVRLRRERSGMSRQQIDELVAEYLEAELWDAETRLATGAWQANDAEEHGDWNDVAQMLPGEEIEKLAGSLQYNRLDGKLEQAAEMLPAATDEEQRLLARIRH